MRMAMKAKMAADKENQRAEKRHQQVCLRGVICLLFRFQLSSAFSLLLVNILSSFFLFQEEAFVTILTPVKKSNKSGKLLYSGHTCGPFSEIKRA